VDGSDYEYRGLIASSWDLLRGDTSGWADRPFYRAVIERSGGPALVVGCGTGRLVLDYLAQGTDVEGLDNSPEMLAICRRKAGALGLHPVLHEQALERLDLPRAYRTILVPSSTFQLVVDAADAAESLRRLHAHLAPGGTLVMSLMVLGGPAEPGEWRLVGEAIRPEDGLLVRRWNRTVYDAAHQLASTEDRYELLDGARVVASERHARAPATRSYTQAQAVAALRAAGFVDVRLTSGFTEQPAAPADPVFCAFGRRAGPPGATHGPGGN
jgi:SAM-dependent methyltransferase